MNQRQKKNRQTLLDSFGNVKDDHFDFEQIEKYFRKKDNSEAFQVLSDKTCNDLDFDELFMFIDRTNSKVGQQYLYHKLRLIPSVSKELTQDEILIEALSNDPEQRVIIQGHLAKLNDPETFYIAPFFQDEHLEQPRWFFMIRLLSFTSLISIPWMFFNPKMSYVLIAVFITNMVIHYWNKKNLYQYLVTLPQLLRLNGVARELFKIEKLRDLSPNLRESISIVDKVRNRMLFFKLEFKLQGDMQIFFWAALEVFKILFLLEPLLLFTVLRQLDAKRKEIENIFTFVGKTDSLISIASLRKGLTHYCKPTILSEQQGLSTINTFHPLIQDCVENSIQVNAKSVLLTGSNMSGKTSFIRSIGINVITGLTINTCFAKQFSLPRMKVFSAIRISDDLMNDKSYYFEEVLTIKKMIDESGSGSANLFLLDEIFKGTNTIERISAGKAVLSFLAKAGNMVFVSTHDIELADLLKNEYDLYHFSEVVDYETIAFDYRLKDGKLKNRNAIRILQINNYPEILVNEAMDIARELDTSK